MEVGNKVPVAQSARKYLALHTLGWKAFQDLCAQICEEVLRVPITIYREAQDGGQDAAFIAQGSDQMGNRNRGTIQCKFVGDPARRMKVSDLTGEVETIRALVDSGLADSYFFITNMGVDAPIAAVIETTLLGLGVREPRVFGLEWITQKISESARLRALVPRIYGLGDLSIILEERRAQQTQALLGHLMPSLRTYVPTAAHRDAVRILSEIGIVLLTGAPAAGKSMIAAILATTVLDSENHRCFQLDGPSQLSDIWNPNETGRFYWVDDAFGPSQVRDDYVDTWMAIMHKVKTAIASGNRFVLTSRNHIWRAAKTRLGLRNHPKLADGSAVVNVGELSPEEQAQILYNHVKEGNQPRLWKARLVPHMDSIARSTRLLPEVARRLGDGSYTGGIQSIPNDVIAFISRPTEFLRDTLNELNEAQRAALTVVFLYRSRFPTHTIAEDRVARVCSKFDVSRGAIESALTQLDGSFVVQKPEGARRIWAFVHPTIADALAAILRDRSDLLELYIQGARAEELLSEVICDGQPAIRDAIVVSAANEDLLIARVLELDDESSLNKVVFNFLSERASDNVLREVVARDPAILRRKSETQWRARYDGRLKLFARLHSMALLPDDLRNLAINDLEWSLFDMLDGSIFRDPELAALVDPLQLLAFGARIYHQLADQFPDRIDAIVREADGSLEPEDYFDDLTSYLRDMNTIFYGDQKAMDAISFAESRVEKAIEEVTEKIALKNKDVVSDWASMNVAPKVVTATSKSRSIFSDVDE